MKTHVKHSLTVLGSMMLLACLVAPSLGAALTPVKTASVREKNSLASVPKPSKTGQSWALIFAVGYYYNYPDADRPDMIDSANSLFSTLTSHGWQGDHIVMMQSNQCSAQNLIRGLLWLRQNAKPEDTVLVYITTHGGQLKHNGLPLDLPPKDENDGMDEFLVMYKGFVEPYAFVYDDELNFFLGLIKCQGLCLIVDSCYSGGFNEPPMQAGEAQASAERQAYVDDFAQHLAAQNRVVLMSCQENEVSWGSYFSEFVIDGLSGSADAFGNHDGINSAEETFAYAQPLTEFWVWLNTGESQTPTMVDSYPGELGISTS